MTNAIYVMWLRQLIRYWRTRSRIIGSLAQPVLFLVALGFGLGPIYAQAGSGDYIQFLAPGIIGMSILFTAMFSGMEVIWDRQLGFLKETLVSPSSRFSIFLGRTLGGATVALIQGIILLLITLLFGFKPLNLALLPLALLFMFLLAFVFTALGTALASKVQDMQAFPMIMNFIIMPVFFLSGAIFPLESAPQGIKIIAMFDPLSYQIDALREIFTGVSHFGLVIDFAVTLVCIIFVTLLGIYLFNRVEV
ncbi:multidrug ABC transporter permease [Candidatus Pacearchaeota archaeon CG10_big_fil_rev_8_21_14_0_10_34_76]|nr:MAG: multidrug ABC transporter permease [Candidatus Pacearchaeota archaeon CG10_big_fil_rev_8_21_14_0_10_34_76]